MRSSGERPTICESCPKWADTSFFLLSSHSRLALAFATLARPRFVSPNHTFTLPPGGSDAVAAGEGCGSFDVCCIVAQTLHMRDAVTDWSPFPSLRLDPPGGRVKSNLVFVETDPRSCTSADSNPKVPIYVPAMDVLPLIATRFSAQACQAHRKVITGSSRTSGSADTN